MKTDIQNLDGIVDQSLKIASRVIAVVAFPAILFAAYRNLAIDFLPYHQVFLTVCYGIFVFLGFGKIKSNQIRFYSLVIIFLSLFIVTGLRNNSIIFVDAVSTTLAPITASLPTWTPSTIIDLEPINELSSIITGVA